MTRVIIIAAGQGTRWADYRGVPKHLVEIEGEILLHRTCGQFLQYSTDVYLVAPDDDRYRVDGVQLYSPPEELTRELDKFYSSLHLWSEQGRTVIVYGDVYFSDEAVETIMTNQDGWKYFCRSKPSTITGKDCKEIFAIGFSHESKKKIEQAVISLLDAKTATGGWSLFRLLTLGRHHVAPSDRQMFETGNHVEIDDWTEDFDYPRDLDAWEANRGKIVP